MLVELGAAANDLTSDTSKVNRTLAKAKAALDSNKISESLQLSNEAFTQSKKIDYTYGLAKSLLLIGHLQFINDKKDSSILTLKKSLKLFKNINNLDEIGSTLNRIGTVYICTKNLDSAEFFCNEALTLRKGIDDKIGEADCINNLGIIYDERGNYSKALEYYLLSLSIQEKNGDLASQPSTLNDIGSVFWKRRDYSKALDYFLKSLKIKNDLHDLLEVGHIYNNIGLIYYQFGNYNLALYYHNESLKLMQLQGDKYGISNSYKNLGDVYQMQGDYTDAMKFYSKAEVLEKKMSNLSGLANLYISIGRLYRAMNTPLKSLTILKEAEKIYKNLDDPRGLANCLIQYGITYYLLKEYNKAIDYFTRGLEQSKEIGALEIAVQGFEYMSKVFEATGDIAQAYSNYKLYINFRDSLYNIAKSKEPGNIHMQIEFDRLEKNQKQEQLTLAQGKSREQARIANIFILAFVITILILIVFFINYRQKQKNNNLLVLQKFDMERQKGELTFQRDELQIQKDLVIYQRDKIMTMLTDLGESIDYARKIQQALLPSDKTLEKLLGEYCLFFQPRESVGGDFYWVNQNENITYFAVADCTGHGVPGGFMSMLGVSLLNEQVSRVDCDSPAKMLWNLREMIIKALSQTGLDEDSQDGMDIALCMYNSQNHHLVYAGANISLFLVTSTPPEAGEKVIVQDKIVEFKPDRMPVSYYMKMTEFNEHHLVLNPGDCIYLSSDGYSDQFGGSFNKKYGYITLKNLLLSISNKPFDKQRDILWNEFDKWKGEENQTDDVIVMGIKIF